MIALIAHNSQKPSLLEFVEKHREFFQKYPLVATEATGHILRTKGYECSLVPHGPRGGDIVIAAAITRHEIKAVFFFRDLMEAQPHEPDVTALLRMCDIYDVPLALNKATAECIVRAGL